MTNLRFWLRWSWRDLRERWLQVAAIALIIALGTGTYAGLGSSMPWREQSYDTSYAQLNMYDMRVLFTNGSYVNGEELIAAVESIEHAGWIEAAEPRLIAPTLVDVSDEGEDILVPGRLIGVTMSQDRPAVNGIHINAGRSLTAEDSGQPRAILEYNFAAYYDLPPQGTILISGGQALDYVGQGMTPEYFMVISDEIGFKEESDFAVVMLPLETAQTLTDHPGQVNDLVLTLADGADWETVRAEVEAAIAAHFRGTGVSFMHTEDDPAYTMLYGDLEGDDQIFKLIAYLFLAGAAFGTFNLSSRIVEAQRRQIGVGMALGLPRRLLAFRPLLVGAQIALLGVVFGVLIGALLGTLFGGMIRDLMPMPVFETPFQWGIFAQAAVLGIGLPLAATLYPVWRAVRVQPIDAIKTGHLIAKGGGLTSLLARVPLPGKSFTQMPLRNLLRAPRRTLLTLLGVAMAITTQIAMIGMLDTFNEVIDQGEQEFMQDSPDRMIVALNNFYPVNAEPVLAVEQAGPVAEAVPAIQLGGELLRGDDSVEVSLELLDLDNPLWTPNLLEGRLESDGPGIIIAEKAADDLGVGVGDTITLKHPRREGMFAYHMVESEIEVIAIHANPLRYLSYMSRDQAGLMGLENMVNVLYLNPADGSTATDVKRVLFAQPGIASVREVGMFIRLFKDMMSLLVGFMSVVVIAVLALAFLIAFNSTSINVDERAREIATLFAFGVPVRTVTRMTMVENLITGILGTLIGIGLGLLSLQWMLDSRIETMLPDISLSVVLSPLALVLAVLLGVVVVTLTPLLNLRKLTRMNLPSTLRVVE